MVLPSHQDPDMPLNVMMPWAGLTASWSLPDPSGAPADPEVCGHGACSEEEGAPHPAPQAWVRTPAGFVPLLCQQPGSMLPQCRGGQVF